MWNTSAKFLIFILYYSGTGLLLCTGFSSYFIDNGSVAVELAPVGGSNPALRYYEPVFYNPSEFMSQHRRKKREIRNQESLRLNIASQSR